MGTAGSEHSEVYGAMRKARGVTELAEIETADAAMVTGTLLSRSAISWAAL
jgi:hypothetical protein